MSGPLLAPLDVKQVRRQFARANRQAGANDPLAREIAGRMAERLDYVALKPSAILDLGAGDGQDSLSLLHSRFPTARLTLLDCEAGRLPRPISGSWWQKCRERFFDAPPAVSSIQGDARAIPLQAHSQQLIWANFLLPWVNDLSAVVAEAHRVLADEGLFMFSTLGPDTLQTLARCFPGAHPHVHLFPDMHDLGDLLVETGFADPVVDMEMLTVRYATLDRLLDDLQGAAAGNAHERRLRGLTGRGVWQQVREAWAAQQAPDGSVSVTFEVVYGHAWRAPANKVADGRQIVRFQPRRP